MIKIKVIILACLAAIFAFKLNSSMACNSGSLLNKYGDFEIYLGSLNQIKNSEKPTLFAAENQRMVFELCILNKGEAQDVIINVCKDSLCTEKDNTYHVKYITSWYKDKNSQKSAFHDKSSVGILIPELLLESGDFLQNDNSTKTTAIKTKISGKYSYIDTKRFETIEKKDKNDRVPHNSIIYNISDLNTNRIHKLVGETNVVVFADGLVKPDSIYLEIAGSKNNGIINIPVNKIPASLTENVNSGIYYRGLYNSGFPALSSERKTDRQLRDDFLDMKQKGINYPTVFIYNDYKKYMQIRGEFDFPKDKLFIFDNILLSWKDKKDWSSYSRRIKKIRMDPSFRGFKMLYFYLADEPNKEEYEEIIKNVKPIMKNANVSFFVAGRENNLLNNVVENAIYVLAYEPKKSISEFLNKHNAKAYTYAIPQIGVYKPNTLRYNYGFNTVINGYSGIMPYAYQDSFGSQWSDFDSIYRDHMLTYPVTDGLVDTIHGLALENAITDMKYMLTLNNLKEEYKTLCNKTVTQSAYDGDINENNLDETRQNIALQIVAYKRMITECQ